MLLLWAGHMVVKSLRFTHVVPHQHVLTLTARKVTGKKQLAIEDVNGHYADWLFAAKYFFLNTPDHRAQLGKMFMDCKNSNIQINAESGILNLKDYTAMIQRAQLTHHNMVFTCQKATYNHQSQKIICFRGTMTVKHYKHPRPNKEI